MNSFDNRHATKPMIMKLRSAARKSPTPNRTAPTSHVAVFQSPPRPQHHYDRHDEIVDECLDQRIERGTDDDRDRESDDVLL